MNSRTGAQLDEAELHYNRRAGVNVPFSEQKNYLRLGEAQFQDNKGICLTVAYALRVIWNLKALP